jgi:hypothetical protein
MPINDGEGFPELNNQNVRPFVRLTAQGDKKGPRIQGFEGPIAEEQKSKSVIAQKFFLNSDLKLANNF